MPQTNLGSLQADYEAALLEVGEYGNKSEIHRAALRCLWEHLAPEKRLAAAVEHYRNGNASITKASILAGLSFHEMQEILASEGILATGHADTKASAKAAKAFAKGL
jgi:predicted HTH domain antitoxin